MPSSPPCSSNQLAAHNVGHQSRPPVLDIDNMLLAEQSKQSAALDHGLPAIAREVRAVASMARALRRDTRAIAAHTRQLVSAVSALTMAIHSLTRGVEAAVQAVASSLTSVGAEGLEQEGTGDGGPESAGPVRTLRKRKNAVNYVFGAKKETNKKYRDIEMSY